MCNLIPHKAFSYSAFNKLYFNSTIILALRAIATLFEVSNSLQKHDYALHGCHVLNLCCAKALLTIILLNPFAKISIVTHVARSISTKIFTLLSFIIVFFVILKHQRCLNMQSTIKLGLLVAPFVTSLSFSFCTNKLTFCCLLQIYLV